ncbi:Apoptosis-inducing factor 2 [Aphanomyces cochlioides]|nr:Apoptosis-inducing factor 2 [Aphanomyces cochlioides]
MVDPSYVKNLFVPLTHALPYPHAKIIRGMADRIETDHLVVRSIVHDQVDSTVHVPFDYLVLATGSSYVSPIKVPNDQYTRETVEKAITDTANHIRAASSVLIIGGGPVGVEAAAEIAHTYPSKRVTILEANRQLLHNCRLKDGFRDQLDEKLAKLNVHVIRGERLPERLKTHSFSSTTVVTDKGTEIQSDVQLVCAGLTPNADLVRRLDPALLSPSNQAIRVTPGCQLIGFNNVFVIGDANDHPTPKTSYMGRMQGQHVATQVAKLLENPEASVEPFVVDESSPDMMVIPLGREGGVGQLPFPGGLLESPQVREIKSRDYFSSKFLTVWNTTLDGERLVSTQEP